MDAPDLSGPQVRPFSALLLKRFYYMANLAIQTRVNHLVPYTEILDTGWDALDTVRGYIGYGTWVQVTHYENT